MADCVGRDAELGAGDAFLDLVARGPAILLLEGEAGIGKSTVWAEIVGRAEARGLRVLRARPAQAESDLTLAALADILEPVETATIAALPEPQRLAMDAAMLVAEPGSEPPQPRVLGTAVRSLLTALAATGPIVIAIDDVQWVDPVSATTLGYALRRIGSARVGVLAARRSGEPIPAGLLDAGLGRAQAWTVGPLSVAALHHVIKRQLGHAPSRSTLVRVHQASDGNPLFALEIARILAEVGEPTASEPLPIPDDVRGLIGRRIRRLPTATREMLLAAAALATPTPELVARAVNRDVTDDLATAEAEGVARVVGGRLVFGHPLLGAAVYGSTPAATRRALHRTLGKLLAGTEEGARHLALGAEGPDEAVAAALEAAAAATSARGAPAAASRLMELALDLTPAEDIEASDRRTLGLANLAARSGDPVAAGRILGGLLDRSASAVIRTRARLALATIRYDVEGGPAAVALCLAALGEGTGDPELEAEAHAIIAAVSIDDFRRGHRHAAEAMRLLDQLPDPDPRVLSLALQGMGGIVANTPGGTFDPTFVERALEAERRAPRPSVGERFSAALGTWFKYRDDFAEARVWLERTLQTTIDEGDDASLPYAYSHLPQLELWTGNWPAAEAYARREVEVSRDLGYTTHIRQGLFNLGMVHVHQGRLDEARRELAEVFEVAEGDGDTWTLAVSLPALGLLELSLGNAAAALGPLERSTALRVEVGDEAPRRHEADHVEALVGTGQLDVAESTVDHFLGRARDYRLRSAIANLLRARGLLEAERGDLAAAEATLREALATHDQVPIPFDRARTLLAQGQVHRRRKERRAASDALEEALATFDRLGAPIWAARARAELDRLGLRRGAADELTEGERRVAELAASGLTNREVASALFLSPKTVEAHLARAYGKLGITSRAELGAVIARGSDARNAS